MRYLVIGAAGHGQEVAWALREQARTQRDTCEMLFFDDRLPCGGLPSGLGVIVGTLDAIPDHADDTTQLVLGIGLPRTKARVVERLAELALPWATVVHPGATIGPGTSIGEGSYVAAGAIVTVDVTIAQFVTVNMHCQVAHESRVGDLATLHPDVHVAGGVTIGEGCELGTGAIVIQNLSVGAWSILGAGCVAVRSLAPERTYVGTPARPLAARHRTSSTTRSEPAIDLATRRRSRS
jgi:sugar O-acyltransferase (sialic acid O-acetyltransferase NeuD family)